MFDQLMVELRNKDYDNNNIFDLAYASRVYDGICRHLNTSEFGVQVCKYFFLKFPHAIHTFLSYDISHDHAYL
jgi:hypothetical protein